MGGSKVNHFFFNIIFILISIASNTICRPDKSDCVYTIYIRTGSIWKGGTDSIITFTLYDTAGYGIRINNIEAWGGLMGSDYDYFERKNLDIFTGRGPCLTGPPCEMNLTSDGSGSHHGWYCNYVEVTTTGANKPCAQQEFEVEQWLATDTWPYELTAIRKLLRVSFNPWQSRSPHDTGVKLFISGSHGKLIMVLGDDKIVLINMCGIN